MKKLLWRNLKRAMSFMLALSMLVGVIPAISTASASEATEGTVVLDFNLKNHGISGYKQATIANQGWAVNFGESASNLESAIDIPNAALSYYEGLGGWLAYPSACSKIVVDFDVKTAGEYTVAMDIKGLVANVDTINFYVITPDANGDFTNATQTKVGTIGHSSFSGESGTWVDMADSITFANVNLKAGTNRFVIEDATTEPYTSAITMRSVTFELVKAAVEEKPGVEVLDFNLKNHGISGYKQATIANQGWAVNFGESASNLESAIDIPNAALSYNESLGGWLAYPSACSKIVVDFDVKTAGEYTVAMDIKGLVANVDTINFYVITPDANGDFTNATQTKVGTIGHGNFSGSGWVDMTGEVAFANVNLKAGINRFVIEDATAETYYSCITMRSVTFKLVPKESNFGENYAYLTKDASGTYKLTVLGGLKNIEGYSEVGFVIGETEIGDNKVYSSITYDDAPVLTSNFGADVGYIFAAVTYVNAGDVTVQAYTIDEEGNYEYGQSYTISVAGMQ